MSAAVSSNISDIESQLKTKAVTKRIRPSEFFLDFDRLRSGFVSSRYLGLFRLFYWIVF